MRKLLIAVAMMGSVAFSSPARSQETAYTPGGYWVVQGVYVEDGQFENYLDYLAAGYRRSQDFARTSGWITSYRILQNVNRRHDEPHLYLITEMPRLPTPQEEMEREKKMSAHMQQTTRQATEASGKRVEIRKLMNNLLLQELMLRPAK